MHDIIGYLRGAVNKTAGGGLESCYVIMDNVIYARGNGLQVGIEWPDASSLIIPAEPLESALSRMKEVQELKIEDDHIIIRSGRLKSTIKRVITAAPPPPDFPDHWLKSPPGLAAALDVAKGFTGEATRASWTMGIRLMSGRVTAFHGEAGIDIAVPELELDRAYLVDPNLAKFLAAQGDPDELACERNAISFRWVDGRWARAQLINDEMPEKIIAKLFADVGSDAPIAIDQDWREALADAAALGDSIVGLNGAGFHTEKEGIKTEIELSSDLDDSHQSWWNVKKLALVFDKATAWSPANYKDPAYFVGDGFRGIVVGVMK